MQECKGVCDKFKATISSSVPKYGNGVYRCRTCDVFLTVNGVDFSFRPKCMCCHQLISSRPRSKTNLDEAGIIDLIQKTVEKDLKKVRLKLE